MRIFTENIVSGKYRIYSENLTNEAFSFAEMEDEVNKSNSNKVSSNNKEQQHDSESTSKPKKAGKKVTFSDISNEIGNSSSNPAPKANQKADSSSEKPSSKKPKLTFADMSNKIENHHSNPATKANQQEAKSNGNAPSKKPKLTFADMSNEIENRPSKQIKPKEETTSSSEKPASKKSKLTFADMVDPSMVGHENKKQNDENSTQEQDNSPEAKIRRYLDRKNAKQKKFEKDNKNKISVDDKMELQDEILNMVEQNPNSKGNIDLNWLDVSDVKDFSNLFNIYYGEAPSNNNQRMRGKGKKSEILQKLNPDISTWDVSSATNTNFMFAFSKFDGDISQWYFSDDWESADSMFMSSDFSGKNLNNNSGIMDISNLKVASYMFSNCKKLNADFTNMKKPEVIDFNDEDTYRGNFDSMFSNSPNATPPEWVKNLIIDED